MSCRLPERSADDLDFVIVYPENFVADDKQDTDIAVNLLGIMDGNEYITSYTPPTVPTLGVVTEYQLSDTEAFPGQLLHLAAFYGNVEFMKDLLHGEQKKYIDSVDVFGRSALYVACSQHCLEAVCVLLEAGANTNTATTRNYEGISKFTTPLHRAASDGRLGIVRLLVANNADIYALDGAKCTPYDLAINNRRMNVVEFLRQEAERRERLRGELGSKLASACCTGDVVTVDMILDQLGPSAVNAYYTGGTTLLYKASEAGHLPVVHLLIEKGAEGKPNKTVSRLTPLHASCNKGHYHIAKILMKNFPALASMCTGQDELLPLHIACAEGRTDIVKLLLYIDEEEVSEAASTPKEDRLQMSPSRRARSGSLMSIKKDSLPYDINSVDASNQTALYLASVSGNLEVVQLLLDYGVACQPITGSLLSLNKERPFVEMEIYSVIGQTALHAVVQSNNLEITKLLLKYGANVNAPIKNKRIQGHRGDASKGSNFHLSESDSNALIEACKVNNTEMIGLLLKHGARDVSNKALYSAMAARNDDVMAMLLIYTGVHMDGEYNLNRATNQFNINASLNASMTSLASMSTLNEMGSTTTLEGPPTVTYRSIQSYCDTMSIESSSTMMSEAMFYSLPRKKKDRVTKESIVRNPMPSTPVAINWHDKKNLPYIKEEWLVEACLHVNHWLRYNIFKENAFHVLQAITRLDVSDNAITELPIVIFQLHSLRILNASKNRIESLPKADFEVLSTAMMGDSFTSGWHCPVLEKIDLSRNCLEALPQQIFRLPSLETLIVSHNRLKAVPYGLWTAPKLTRLTLSHNELSDLPYSPDTDTFTGGGDVSVCDVGVSVFDEANVRSNVGTGTGLPMEMNAEYEEKRNTFHLGLKRYSIWRNSGLTIDSPDEETDDEQSTNSMLEMLDISHNCFRSIPIGLPCVAPKLTKLIMSYNGIKEIGPLNQFPAGLKHLLLANNRIMLMSKPKPDADRGLDMESYATNIATTMSLCFGPSMASRRSSTSSSSSRSSQHSSSSALFGLFNMQCCKHRRHRILATLRTLDLNNNRLKKLDLMLPPDRGEEDENAEQLLGQPSRRRSTPLNASIQPLFPELSQLKVSNNRLTEIPAKVEHMAQLTAIHVDGNSEVTTLPPEIGRCNRIYDIRTEGCNLEEPFKQMVKHRSTRDILGYLRSVLDKSRRYSRMKLMFVGVQGIGKTTLLNQLRREGIGSYQNRPAEGWARRQGNRNIDQKTRGGTYISTVGVDVCDWTYPRSTFKAKYGQVTFSTWDFGGQKEYYATHQYFLSKRSLYLLLWRIIDGEKGVNELQQWLVNIQVRAPDSPVIIVGTHYDEVQRRKHYPKDFSHDLQKMIYDKFINLEEPETHGLPQVIESIEVSCTRGHNINKLRDLIYETAFSLRQPGPTNGRLLEQMIPATYLALEEAVTSLVADRYGDGKDPVLDINHYRLEVMRVMEEKRGLSFRDLDELKQATRFLHENGVLLHYDDVTLCNHVFLDPQWLCDMLAHVVTIREINPFAKHGIMKTSDLQQLFKATKMAPINIEDYILNLLNKFEVAVTWDNMRLIIPSMLPTEEQLNGVPPGSQPMIPVRVAVSPQPKAIRKHMSYPVSRVRHDLVTRSLPSASSVKDAQDNYEIGYSTFFVPSPTHPEKSMEQLGLEKTEFDEKLPGFPAPFSVDSVPKIENISLVRNVRAEMHRLYLMRYIPSGFWSRLITRMLASESIYEITRSLYQIPKYLRHVQGLVELIRSPPHWIAWQTGVRLVYRGTKLMEIKQVLKDDIESSKQNKQDDAIKICSDSSIGNISRLTKLIISIPNQNILVTILEGQVMTEASPPISVPNIVQLPKAKVLKLQASKVMAARLLAFVVEQIDTLLEDWYPNIGERFSQTLRGEQLIARIAPCTRCYVGYQYSVDNNDDDQDLGDEAWEVVAVSNRDNNPYVSLQLASPLEEDALRKRGFGQSPSVALVSGDPYPDSETTAITDAENNITQEVHPRVEPVQPRELSTPGIGASHQKRRSNIDETKDEIFQLSLDDNEVENDGKQLSKPLPIPQHGSEVQRPREWHPPVVQTVQTTGQHPPQQNVKSDTIYGYMFEECISRSLEANTMTCPVHGEIPLKSLVPDAVFLDLGPNMVFPWEDISQSKLLGKGAFGFVFRGQVHFENQPPMDVAIKALHPCHPGSGAKQAHKQAYENALKNWQYNSVLAACRANRTARQELAITGTLQHPNIVGLIGLCPRPLCLLLELAPESSLAKWLRNYRRNGCRLSEITVQKIILQIASAVEYLHSHNIIHRDLKAENVLVWSLPAPYEQNPNIAVEVKLTDYGISRASMPTGTKGYGGTEGFMAPEIIQFKGEETYTEKVDCFSFGMFIYELLALRHPYESVEQIQQHVKEGIRPAITAREKVYPTYILDLMTWCWSQDPRHRPSAAQIVTLSNSPEFAHLAEAVSLEYRADIMAACAVSITTVWNEIREMDEAQFSESDNESDITDDMLMTLPIHLQTDVWLTRVGRDRTYVDILKLNERCLGTDHEQFHLPKTSVESICAVNDTVWVALPTGHIQIYNATTYQEIAKFPLYQNLSKCPPISQCMQYVMQLNQVFVAVSNGSVLSYTLNNGIPELNKKYIGFGKAAYSLAAVPVYLADKQCCYDIWCGQSDGYITVLNSDLSVKHRGLNHFTSVSSSSKNVGVYHMVTNDNTLSMDLSIATETTDEQSVWTYVFPGSSIYRWDVLDRTIHGKLDCGKVSRPSVVRPPSGKRSGSGRNKCHVTAMCYYSNHLYIGTSWGQLLVVEPFSLTPYAVFACHEQPVKAILPVKPGLNQSDTVLHPNSTVIITIGRGYKNLIGRYPNAPAIVRAGSSEETYVLAWNADSWM